MKMVWKCAQRLSSTVCLVALAACSGGGGGGTSALGTTPTNTASNNPTNNTTSGNTTTGNTTGNTTSNNTTSNNTTTPTVAIGAPDDPSAALQTQPVYNFTTNPPLVGTVIGVAGPSVKVTSTTVSAAGIGNGSQAVYRGTVTSNGQTFPVFDLNIPALSLSASNVRGDGTVVTLADGSKIAAAVGTLNYTLLGAWTYAPASGGTAYFGAIAAGSATPAGSVPTAGSATYNGTGANGGAVGAYFVPSGSGTIAAGSLQGSVSVTANFATNAVNGSMTSMTATPSSGGTATPWNDVTLSGSISRSSGPVTAINGTTVAGAAPAGAGTAGFSSSATGKFFGGFFGPNTDEVGGTWTLTDPNAAGGGKTAFGAFAGAK